MVRVVEFNIVKYPSGKHPHYDGTVIWGRVVTEEEFTKRKKAFYRLANMIEASDPDRTQYLIGDTLEVSKVAKGAAFNDRGDLIYTEDLSGTSPEYKELRKNVMALLCREMSIHGDHDFFSVLKSEKIGKNNYITGVRHTKVYGNEDKRRIVQQKIAGRKSAISKSINKAKAIIAEYQKGLFPDEYRSDKKYISLLKHLPAQRKRLYEAECMKCEDIEDISGSIDEASRSSLERLLETLYAEVA